MRKHTYIADPIRANARILAHSRLAGSGPDQYFYLHDRLGSVRQLKDCLCEERSDVAISSPSTTSRPTTPVFHTPNLSVGWQPQAQLGDGLERGQYLDAQTAEYHLRARQYNPTIARFTARDPVFGKLEQPLTLHNYLYCGSDPVNLTDPGGLWYTDLNWSYSYGTGDGLARGGPWGALGGSLTLTGGLMFGTEEGARTPDLYSYFGGGLTLSAKGGHTFMLTGSLDDVSRGWNFAATVIAPTGHVAQVGWSGELSNPSTFFDDLKYGACEWAEAGVKLGGGAKLPSNIPKYLKNLDPKWLLKNSTRPKSIFSAKDWIRNACVSVTGFYVWGWDVFSGDWIDRNFAAAEMFSDTPSAIGLNTRNVMMAELLGGGSPGW